MRIEQPVARRPMCGGGVNRRADDLQIVFSRGLDETAVATLRATACEDRSVELCRIVGPDDDRAAVACRDSVGGDARVGGEICSVGVVDRRVAALIIATNQYGAAARVPGGIDACVLEQANVFAQ